ncbi:transcriptional regulator [Liquorilactobacillus sucicola DSM 21376 = JCM 15457]|uniref:Transcription regulator n=1 Tax=Liquorilactobacillus sucicola DSM 21376 = JCM 15457 TaxID=1423806 RepID=A0A023CXB9_9LACO|nr:TetR/AcrR family transcriptional regulator [Liquorilactobacillus sucicola]KRN06267.1 transcription regulator [Liquorilactobacillus sucicola DSM 21376 = JCM 15457]GAJ26206.1 transcriptional regulator [Liquorilactobacillus sucicola DSM 21376 = JCM 15457]
MSPQEMKNKKLIDIFQAFINLLQVKNSETITITELTQKAGVSRTYYYKHFTTFDDIISEFEMLSIIKYIRQLPNQAKLNFSTLMEHYFQLALSNIDSQLTLLRSGKEQVMIKSFVTTYQYLLQNDMLIKFSKNGRSEDKYWADFIAGAVVNTSLGWLKRGATETPRYMGEKMASFLELN